MMTPRGVLPVALLLLLAPIRPAAAEPKPLQFDITFNPSIRTEPFTGRVLIFLADAGAGNGGLRRFLPGGSAPEPRLQHSWLSRDPLFSTDVKDWKPGEPIHVRKPNGYPYAIGELPKKRYRIQAVMHTNPDRPHSGNAPGNLYSAVVTQQLDPATGGTVRLKIDKRVDPPRHALKMKHAEVVELRSDLLSKFHGRDILMRAVVLLPDEYETEPERRFPALYIIPGFGADHTQAARYAMLFGGLKTPFVRVALDPTSPHGHHVFADSDNCGPRGTALVREFIPYLERRFRLIAEPRARLLTGHSSGGWATLWLQISHPDVFGGTWSTSPDPVDFHDFCGVDLYDSTTNLFLDAKGERRPIMRQGGKVRLYLDDFARMEDVLGPGGQLHSFEAVFGPRGPDGRPVPAFDRRTGKIDRTVLKAWRRYDIVEKIEREWKTLGPKLAGRVTVIIGDEDNFYLEGAVRRLKAAFDRLGADARVIIVPGKDHSSIMFSKPFRKMVDEMSERFLRSQPSHDDRSSSQSRAGPRIPSRSQPNDPPSHVTVRWGRLSEVCLWGTGTRRDSRSSLGFSFQLGSVASRQSQTGAAPYDTRQFGMLR